MASSCGGGVLQTLSRAQSGVRRPGTPFHLLPLITCFVFHLVGILHSRCAQLWVSILFSIDASVSVCMRATLVYGILFQSGFDAFLPPSSFNITHTQKYHCIIAHHPRFFFMILSSYHTHHDHLFLRLPPQSPFLFKKRQRQNLQSHLTNELSQIPIQFDRASMRPSRPRNRPRTSQTKTR